MAEAIQLSRFPKKSMKAAVVVPQASQARWLFYKTFSVPCEYFAVLYVTISISSRGDCAPVKVGVMYLQGWHE